MAKGNLSACLAVTLPHEGGYTNDRRDPGNWTGGKVGVGELKGTKKGIAAKSFPNLDIKNLTDAQIADIYKRRYWEPIRGDELPAGPDLSVFDAGVNSGPSRSVKWAQTVAGAAIDGKMGPQTLGAIKAMPARTFIKRHCARRLSFVQSLKIWNTFGKGWSRRIADVEAKALSWVSLKTELEQDAKDASKDAGKSAGGAVVTTGGGVAVDQAPDPSGAPDLLGLPWWGIAVIVVLIAAPFVIRTVIHMQRAAALRKVAKEA